MAALIECIEESGLIEKGCPWISAIYKYIEK